MMRKLIFKVFAVLAVCISLSACGPLKKVTDADGPIRVACIVDTVGINDRGFNQVAYEASKDYCEKSGFPFTYYVLEKNTPYAKRSLVDAAVASGYNVVIFTGNNFSDCAAESSRKYPDVKFICLDISADTILSGVLGPAYDGDASHYDLTEYCDPGSMYRVTYSEHIPGYMAGYAAVKLGYEKLGFLGGVEVPAVSRYGYGFLKGVNDAAKELGKTDRVSVRYAHAGTFSAAPEITAAMETWYHTGTEAVFACGGGIYVSIAEAAAKYRKKTIGVDVDQKEQFDEYAKGMAVTSALKDMGASIRFCLSAIENGTWERDCAGKEDLAGLVSSEDLSLNYVGLPLDSTQWNGQFTVEDYRELVRKLVNGELVVNGDIQVFPKTDIRVDRRQGTIL